jgi:Lrp/AsnC family transcriptional regulator for asnA, asnC and gidA
MGQLPDIDKLDHQILSILMRNVKIPYTEIAKKLQVSGGTIHVRMKKLEESGIVKGYHLSVNPEKLGYDVTAFLGIYLDKSSHYTSAIEGLENIPEIVSAHYTTGLYNIFTKVYQSFERCFTFYSGDTWHTAYGDFYIAGSGHREESFLRHFRKR